MLRLYHQQVRHLEVIIAVVVRLVVILDHQNRDHIQRIDFHRNVVVIVAIIIARLIIIIQEDLYQEKIAALARDLVREITQNREDLQEG
jgi:hypothetical protein